MNNTPENEIHSESSSESGQDSDYYSDSNTDFSIDSGPAVIQVESLDHPLAENNSAPLDLDPSPPVDPEVETVPEPEPEQEPKPDPENFFISITKWFTEWYRFLIRQITNSFWDIIIDHRKPIVLLKIDLFYLYIYGRV